MGSPHIRWIPWEIIAPHEAQAQKNHGQTLGGLASRGGLGASEAVAILRDESFWEYSQKIKRALDFPRPEYNSMTREEHTRFVARASGDLAAHVETWERDHADHN